MKVITTRDELGKVVYNSELIPDIVRCAIAEVKGVTILPNSSKQGRRSIRVNIDKNIAHIEVFVRMSHNVAVNDTASDVQRSIKMAIETNTDFGISGVDVHVIDVDFVDHE